MKILLHTDLDVGPRGLFWHRDLGLLTKAFRSLGHESWLVVHPTSETPSIGKQQNLKTPKEPVIWATPSEVRNPVWWRTQQPDLVILGLWTRPKYDPIRRAALMATPKVMERADSDGVRTASCGLRNFAQRRFDYFRDRTYSCPSLLSIPASGLYSLASILATPWTEARLTNTLRLLPAILVETPAATKLWKKLAIRLGADPRRIHCIPHPIQTSIFRSNPAVTQKKQVVAVGRWESYQKNLPLLLKTLTTFCSENAGWKALVIGSGLPEFPPHPCITFSKPLAAPQLAHRMQESRIFLCTSRYESFGLAGAEAAACGCVVAAPAGCTLAAPSVQPLRGEGLLTALSRASRHPPKSLKKCTGMDWDPLKVGESIVATAQGL